MAKQSKSGTLFREENNELYRFRRGQFVVFVLSVVIVFLLLNATYAYVDLSASRVRWAVITAAVLVGIEAVLSVTTLLMSYQHNKRK